jgi:hypothetical protein
MSDKAGRQSPPPEQQSDKQVSNPSDGKAGAASNDTHSKEKSEQQKDTVLESNPKHPLADKAEASLSKEGRGPGI